MKEVAVRVSDGLLEKTITSYKVYSGSEQIVMRILRTEKLKSRDSVNKE